MSDNETTSREILAEAMAAGIVSRLTNNNRGVRFAPYFDFDRERFIESLLSEASDRYQIGLCLNDVVATDVSVEDLSERYGDQAIRIDSSIHTAVGWRDDMRDRNEADSDSWTPDKIIVLSQTESSKEGSLDLLESMQPGAVRSEISHLMSDEVSNEPAENVWTVIGDRPVGSNFDLRSVARYAANIKDSERPTKLMRDTLYLLKLFPDEDLTSQTDVDAIEHRLAENYELSQDLQNSFTGKQLSTLRSQVGEAEDVDSDELHPAEIIRRLQSYQKTGDPTNLEELQYTTVQEVLSGNYASGPSGGTTTGGGGNGGGGNGEGGNGGRGGGTATQISRTTSEQLIQDAYFDEANIDDLSRIEANLEDFNSVVLEGGNRQVELEVGDNRKRATLEGDPNKFRVLSGAITEHKHGGIITGVNDITDIFDEEEEHDFTPFDFATPSRFARLREAAEASDDFEPVLNQLETFLSKREDLLEDLAVLTFYPFVGLTVDDDLRRRANEYIDAYTDLAHEIQQNIDSDGQTLSDNFIIEFLTQDTLIVEVDTSSLGSNVGVLLSPIYPPHLWKYLDLSNGLVEHGEEFSRVEKEFFSDAIDSTTNYLQTLDIPNHPDLHIPELRVQYAQDYETLSYYTPTRSVDPGDNKIFTRRNLDRLTTSYPHSKSKFRLSVADPVDASVIIDEVMRAEEEVLNGIDLEFAFILSDREQLIGNVSDEKQEQIINFFTNDVEDDKFTIRTLEFENYGNYISHLSKNPKHFVVINDFLQLEESPLQQDLRTRLNNSRVKQHLEHQFMEDILEKQPAPDEDLFQRFISLANQVSDSQDESETDERLEITEQEVTDVLDHTLWEAIAVPRANSDPFYHNARLIAKETYSDRNYAIYTDDRGYFKRQLRRIIRPYPLDWEDGDIENIIEYVVNSQRAGLLGIISAEDEMEKIQRYDKGILGSILGIKWLEGLLDGPNLIFSIDDPITRNWLNLDDSSTRADYFVLSLEDDNRLALEIVEVKTYETPENVISIDSSQTPPVASGKAVSQVVGTMETINDLFVDDNVTSLPRREALRDQIYYELLSVKDEIDRLSDWVEALDATFNLERHIDINGRVISVEMQEPGESVTRISNAIPSTEEYDWARPIEVDKIPIGVIEDLISESGPGR